MSQLPSRRVASRRAALRCGALRCGALRACCCYQTGGGPAGPLAV